MPFESFIKFCKECNIQLKLNNSRDIERKNFCSHSCRAKFTKLHLKTDVIKLISLMNTPEANAKKARKGELNGRWIKDRNALQHRGRFENYEWKRKIMICDEYTCQHCKKIGGKLEVHHKAPYKLFKNLRFETNNGLTLCSSCHKQLHSAFTKMFGAISSIRNINYAI
jgi:hypothetical protein